MKKIILYYLIIFSCSAFAKNILVIGDSHMAGPFGKNLFSNLSQDKNNNVALYGHASSAGIHWAEEKNTSVSGGVFHSFSYEGKIYNNPTPTHWKESVAVPKAHKLFDEFTLHPSWKQAVKHSLNPDIIVIELGANDLRIISNESGAVNKKSYELRLAANKKLVEMTMDRGAKCYWVGPPDGIKKSKERQDVVYQMLNEVVQGKCEFFNSRKYNVNVCDGIHYNCPAGSSKAREWAREVADFVLKSY
jgi:hypothetical protein